MDQNARDLPQQPEPAAVPEPVGEAATADGDTNAASASNQLRDIVARLETLSAELEAGPDPERADVLVSEVSELAARAGREVEAALEGSTEPATP